MFENKERWWDPVSAAFLSLLALIATTSLVSTDWTPDLDRIPLINFSAISLGYVIGLSKFKRAPANILMGLYSFSILLLLGVIPLNSDPEWSIRLMDYSERITKSINQLMNNVPLDDSVIFWTLMMLVFWLTGLIAAFQLVRTGQSKTTALIFTSLFFSFQYFSPDSKRNYFLVFFFSFILILYFGRLFYTQQTFLWKKDGIREDREVVWSLTGNLVITSIIILTLSWGIVSVIEKASERKSGDLGDTLLNSADSWDFFNNLFNPLNQTVEFGSGDFSENLYIGKSRSLSEDVEFVMSIPPGEDTSINYYWKARTYSSYANGQWSNNDSQAKRFSDMDFHPAPSSSEELLTYQIEYFSKNKQIFMPTFGIPVGVDAEVFFFRIDNNHQDIIAWEGVRPFRNGDKVGIRGYTHGFKANEIDVSSPAYPQWVTNYYLDIPKGLKEKIQELANSIVPEDGTKLEKITAINAYLRENFIYKDVVNIPENQEPIEHFLFESKEGFCNHFASAEVLLLRSVGIPARLAVGFSIGESINKLKYLVRTKDSHAWVEVYFPETGWVIFEPTPTLPNLEYDTNGFAKKANGIIDLEDALPSRRDDNSRIPEDIYLNKDFTASGRKLSRQPYYFVFFSIFLLFLTVYIFVFRENKIFVIPLVEKAFALTGAKTPGWLGNWSAYERMPDIAKRMKKVRWISTLLVADEEKLTPNELFNALDQIIIGKSDQFEYFLRIYHQAVFGGKAITNERMVRQVYTVIIGSILSAAVKRFASKWMPRKKTGQNN